MNKTNNLEPEPHEIYRVKNRDSNKIQLAFVNVNEVIYINQEGEISTGRRDILLKHHEIIEHVTNKITIIVD